MKIDIITIFPQMFEQVFDWGIIEQAKRSGIVDINIIDLRNWGIGTKRQVDDRPYGGGAGMVIMPEPLSQAIESVKTSDTLVIFLTPSGETLKQENSEELSTHEHLIIICGRYEGIDQRIIDMYVDKEISIGNYVLSGGEIPAMVLVDSVIRLIPGVIKNQGFNDSESFSNPNDRTALDYPQYTRPVDFKGLKVPHVLTTGNHEEIKKWRQSKVRKIS